MEVTLTWDLLIIVCFSIIIAYSFIIGKHESVKIIISTYMAIVAIQGVGNILERLSGQSEPMLNVLGVSVDFTLLSTTKLLLFVTAIIFMTVRGGMEIEYTKETGGVLDTVLTGLFGLGTAGLLMTTLLTYVAGLPLLDKGLAESEVLKGIIEHSNLMQLLVINQDLWFALPALLLLGVGFLSSGGELE